MDAKSIFSRLKGNWTGSCKTWFQPDQIGDESPIHGSFAPVFGGAFLRHDYTSAIKGKPRSGEATIVYNEITQRVQEMWMDSFHMNYAILDSLGGLTPSGLVVQGSYDTGALTPRWNWKTEYQLTNDDHLLITAFNISPDGEEAKAVEIEYART